MKLLFVADLHYSLKQFDWLLAEAPKFDAVSIGGDLLDLSDRPGRCCWSFFSLRRLMLRAERCLKRPSRSQLNVMHRRLHLFSSKPPVELKLIAKAT